MNAPDNGRGEAASQPLVLPGDPLELGGTPGRGIFRHGDQLHAAVVGFEKPSAGYANVAPLRGPYLPRIGDRVIAIVMGTGPSYWRIDINTAFGGTLHHSETEWEVPFGDTASFMALGDAFLAEVLMADRSGTNQVTLKAEGCRKFYHGTLVKVPPSRVPRVIGRGGTMVTQIRQATDTRIQIGQNGYVWVDGAPGKVALAQQAIELAARVATSSGLTERVARFLTAASED